MPTSVTGNVKDMLGVANTSGVKVKLSLKWSGNGTPRVGGTALVLSSGASGADRVVSEMAINSSTGAITGSVYSTRDAAGTGNGEIELNGSLIACYYEVQVSKSGGQTFKFPVHANNGATLDLTSATPITTSPVVIAPTGDTTYARLDGGNQPFGGLIQFLQGLILGAGKLLAWGSVGTASVDTGLSRTAAKTVAVGNGTQGDASGGLLLATVNKVAITQPATGSTLTIVDGKTAKVDNTLELAGPDGSVQTFQATGTIVSRTSTDTLTSKTLTAPVITNPSTTGTDSGAETLINKVLLGTGVANSVNLLNSQDTLGAVTGTGADNTLYTFTIPANTIQAGKGFRVRCIILSNNSVSVSYKLTVGATLLSTIANSGGVENDDFVLEVFNNAGVQNAQTSIVRATIGSVSVAASATSAENFANAIAVKITANEAAANTVTPKKWFMELIQ